MCRSHIARGVLLTCEAEERAVDGEERGDSSKETRCARGIEEGWRWVPVIVETAHEIGFVRLYFIENVSREFD